MDRMTDTDHPTSGDRPTEASTAAENGGLQPDSRAAAAYVAALQVGDGVAWNRFMKEQGRIVLAVGRRLGLTDVDRDELFQSSCLVAYRSIGQLRDPGRLSSWIYSIAYRQGIELASRRRSEAPVENEEANPLDMLADPGPHADRVLEEVERSLHVRGALAEIGQPCQGLLEALYLDAAEPSYEVISGQLGMPIGSIGPTRARCLEKLRRILLRVSGEGQLGTTDQETPEWTGRESRRKKS